MSWLVLEVLLIQSSSELAHLRLFPPQLLLQAALMLTGAALHGVNNYKDTKPYMSSLLVFNRFYKLEKQSVMLILSTGFLNYCPSNLLSGLAPPFPVRISINIRK